MAQKKRINHIMAVSFRREKDVPWEYGLIFNEGELSIIDMHGKEVREVYNYLKHPMLLSITLPEVMTKEHPYGTGE